MRIKRMGTWDGEKLRLFRVMWANDTRFLSVGLWRRLLLWDRNQDGEWRAALLGIALHYRRSCSGRFA